MAGGIRRGARGFAGAIAAALDRVDEAIQAAALRLGQAAVGAGRRARRAMPGVAAWRSLGPLTAVLVAVLVVGGVALLTRDLPASGGGASRGPVGVAASTTPRSSPVASAGETAKPTPVAPTTPTPPLTGELPRVEALRSMLRAWRDPLGNVKVQVVVEVRNRGPGLAAIRSGTVSYTLDDTNGRQLYEGLFPYAFPSTLRPTETAFLVDTATLEFVEPSEVGAIEVEFEPARAKGEAARLRVEDVAWSQASSGGGLEVSGRIVNPGKEVSGALVAVILLDADGGILGAVYDTAGAANIAAGGQAEFRTAYPGTPPLLPADVASVRAVAFDP